MIELRVLGGVSLVDVDGDVGDVDAVIAQPKRLALLAYLALARPRGFHRRSTLLALFWPEQDEQHARWSLNQSLRYLRNGLGPGVIVSRGPDEVGLDFEAIWCDGIAFESACDQSTPDVALSLYRGDLLDGLYVSGGVELERWVDDERMRLRRLAARAAWEQADRLSAAGKVDAAVESARWAVSLSEHDEKGIRRLIELLDSAGDRAGAIRAYEDYAGKLREELDVEPAPETQALVASVKSREPIHDGFTLPVSESIAAEVRPDGGTSEGVTRTGLASSTGRHQAAPTRQARPAIYVIAAAGLALIAAGFSGLYSRLGDRGPRTGSPEMIALLSEPAAPGVAVLPFRVSASEQEGLSEGMVDLLFADLDGIGGLRPISPWTVLARWKERGSGEDSVDLGTALEVAVSTGARYAVVGSAVAIGPRVRLAASIYDVSGTAPLGRAAETTHRDSIWDAVDRLAIEVVRAISEADSGELARIDLRDVTTGSPEALKAYLQAEALYRRAEIEAAAAAYENALAEDSAFALAHLGLAWTLEWDPLDRTPKVAERPEHMRASLTQSLSKRRELYARASLGLEFGYMDVALIDELEEAVRAHPDDAHLWYLLAEHYMHIGTLIGYEDHGDRAERALERAVALVPDFVPYWFHLMDLAFIAGDADRTEEVWARVAGLVGPTTRTALAERAQFELAYVSSPGDASFQAALDTLEQIGALIRVYNEILPHPAQWPAARAVNERLVRGRPDLKDCSLHQRSLTPGHYRAFLAEATRPPIMDRCLFILQMFDLPVPEQLVDSVMTARLHATVTEGTTPSVTPGPDDDWAATRNRVSLALPAYFADHGRWAEYDTVLAIWRANGAAARVAGDTRASRLWPNIVTTLEGYAEWKRGHPQQALEILETLPPEARWWPEIRWWLGSLYLELDRPAEAVRQFRTLQGVYFTSNWTLAYLRLGQAYERLGELQKAREQYSYFVDAWKDADPELRSLVEQGREALVRLGKPGR